MVCGKSNEHNQNKTLYCILKMHHALYNTKTYFEFPTLLEVTQTHYSYSWSTSLTFKCRETTLLFGFVKSVSIQFPIRLPRRLSKDTHTCILYTYETRVRLKHNALLKLQNSKCIEPLHPNQTFIWYEIGKVWIENRNDESRDAKITTYNIPEI